MGNLDKAKFAHDLIRASLSTENGMEDIYMNAISAQDIKRRGVLALQEAAKDGTVHILKHNRPVGVFLSEDAYRALITAQSKPSDSLLDWMLNKPATGQETAESIHARLHQERETWD